VGSTRVDVTRAGGGGGGGGVWGRGGGGGVDAGLMGHGDYSGKRDEHRPESARGQLAPCAGARAQTPRQVLEAAFTRRHSPGG